MITSIVLKIIYLFLLVVTWPIRILSDVSLDSGMGAALITAKDYIASISDFFPVDTLLIVLGIIVTIELGIFAYKGIMWGIKRIPFIG